MRLLLTIGISLFLFSCSSGSDSKAPKEHAKRGESTPTASKTAPSAAADNAEGEKLFKMKCSACHKVDKKLIGPPLKGVLAEHWGNNKEDLYRYVRNWKDANDAGIARAIEIEDYDPSVMTLFPELDDAKLDAIFDYIEKN